MKKLIKLDKISENAVFLVAVCLIFLFGMACFFKTQKKTSQEENRSLAQFSHLTIRDVLDGEFQDNFENAFSDQFLLSRRIKSWYGEMTAVLPKFGVDTAVCYGRYVSLPNDTADLYRSFDCDDYILHKPETLSENKERDLDQNVAKFNHINAITDAYYYVINTSSTFDFESGTRVVDYGELLNEKMDGNYTISSLKYNNYDEYKNLFYKTDHHWNYKGSYQGFLDISKMLGVENPAVPTDTVTNHENFFGTLSKATRKYDSLEEFTIYTYDIPKHDVSIDVYGKTETVYSHIDRFVNHDYTYSRNTSFYADTYGFDRGEIVFDFNEPKKENLAIVADSFSNPINELIAQYYNKTYVLDLRNYEKHTGKRFVLSEYLRNHNIDKMLFIMSSDFFLTQGNTTKGLEL